MVSDPETLMYAVQQQALGSIQWTIIASSLKQTSYTVSSLSKGVRYAFRVLSITSKAFSKPSLATEPILLVDRGTAGRGPGKDGVHTHSQVHKKAVLVLKLKLLMYSFLMQVRI